MIKMYLKLIQWILALSMLHASVTDIKKREIPLLTCALACTFTLVVQLLFCVGWQVVLFNLGAGLILAALYLINALFFNGGGGDCLLAFLIGLALGLPAGLTIVILSCLLLGCYHLLAFQRRENYPLAPFFLISTLLYFQITGGHIL